jgi:hypothetical protein
MSVRLAVDLGPQIVNLSLEEGNLFLVGQVGNLLGGCQGLLVCESWTRRRHDFFDGWV